MSICSSRSALGAWVAVLALFASACTPNACLRESDCAAAFVCTAGACVPQSVDAGPRPDGSAFDAGPRDAGGVDAGPDDAGAATDAETPDGAGAATDAETPDGAGADMDAGADAAR